MRRRDVLRTSGGVLAGLAGCLGSSEAGSEEPTATDQTPTGSETEPGYTTCRAEAVSSTAPESARDLPDSLTHDQVVGYVDAVERDIVLPADADGYVKIGEIATESVAHGSLARVPVNGGYYNKPTDDDATETTHYDLGTHTASYFLTEGLVRRVTAQGTADPRTQGDLLVCQ